MAKVYFDDLIRDRKDVEALRFFANEYYHSGRMGHTRKRLIDRAADEIEKLRKENEQLKEYKRMYEDLCK